MSLPESTPRPQGSSRREHRRTQRRMQTPPHLLHTHMRNTPEANDARRRAAEASGRMSGTSAENRSGRKTRSKSSEKASYGAAHKRCDA